MVFHPAPTTAVEFQRHIEAYREAISTAGRLYFQHPVLRSVLLSWMLNMKPIHVTTNANLLPLN